MSRLMLLAQNRGENPKNYGTVAMENGALSMTDRQRQAWLTAHEWWLISGPDEVVAKLISQTEVDHPDSIPGVNVVFSGGNP